MPHRFPTGAAVRLRGQTLTMTVTRADAPGPSAGSAYVEPTPCSWHDAAGNLQTAVFEAEALELARNETTTERMAREAAESALAADDGMTDEEREFWRRYENTSTARD